MVDPSAVLTGKVLVVDDQPASVSLLERMLHGAGYTSVTSTQDAEGVPELHRANHYDLILLDLQMPGMDGFRVLEKLKEVEAGGYLSVIAMTAHPGHKERALQAGAKDFISKPFNAVEVLTRVYNMLELRLLHKSSEENKAKLGTAHTLLYVEDSAASVRLVEQLVSRRTDLRLLSAQDASLGIALARASQPAVILMDINLPGISGLEALKLLRADPATAHIPVVALSANAAAGDAAKGMEAGFFRYVAKPFRVDELMQALDMAVAFAEHSAAHV